MAKQIGCRSVPLHVLKLDRLGLRMETRQSQNSFGQLNNLASIGSSHQGRPLIMFSVEAINSPECQVI